MPALVSRFYRWEPGKEFARVLLVTVLAALARCVLAANAAELANPTTWETGAITAFAQAVATALLAALPAAPPAGGETV